MKKVFVSDVEMFEHQGDLNSFVLKKMEDAGFDLTCAIFSRRDFVKDRMMYFQLEKLEESPGVDMSVKSGDNFEKEKSCY